MVGKHIAQQTILVSLLGAITTAPFVLRDSEQTLPTSLHEQPPLEQRVVATPLIAPLTTHRFPVSTPAIPSYFDPATMVVMDGKVYVPNTGCPPPIPRPRYVEVDASFLHLIKPARNSFVDTVQEKAPLFSATFYW